MKGKENGSEEGSPKEKGLVRDLEARREIEAKDLFYRIEGPKQVCRTRIRSASGKGGERPL